MTIYLKIIQFPADLFDKVFLPPESIVCLGALYLCGITAALIPALGLLCRCRWTFRLRLLLTFGPLHRWVRLLWSALVLGLSLMPLFGPFPLGALTFISLPVALLHLRQIGWVRPRKGLPLQARKISRANGQRLWNSIDRLASRLNLSGPDEIIAGLEPLFFVTQYSIPTIEGQTRGRTLYLSLPLCRILSLEEFDAIMAHELSHLGGYDSHLNRWFEPNWERATLNLKNIRYRIQTQRYRIDLIAFARVLSFLCFWFKLAATKTQHQRELDADRKSSQALGARPLATGLTKLQQFSRVWHSTQDLIAIARKHDAQIKNESQLFQILTEACDTQPLTGYAAAESPSHPALLQRLRALKVSPEQLSRKDLELASPIDSAIRLIPGCEVIETFLTNLRSNQNHGSQ